MELLKISDRLRTVAGMINKGGCVADIGTDHAYLPIYIVKEHISDKVIAMDVRKGPLAKAKENVSEYNAEHNIELRLSDGLEKLEPHEADTITICGMGGPLIQAILERGRDKFDGSTQLIVSPQSEVRQFREYLYNNGYKVICEKMLDEDGQFYFIMECRSGCDSASEGAPQEVFLRYGRTLLEEKNESLYKYLERERRNTENVLQKLSRLDNKDEALIMRINQLEYDMKCLNRAFEYYR